MVAISAFYFTGFVGGIVVLPLPDKLGRKGSFKIFLSILLIASAFTLYSPSQYIKTIAMFIQGFFHIKNTLSYTNMIELLPDNSKEACLTIICFFDQLTLLLISAFMCFVTRDLVGVIQNYNIIGSLFIVIYLMVAPESPYFLITRNRKEEAIKMLNYIAWFNGTEKRIPEAA